MGKIRITAGALRSRVLNVPDITGLRPTSSRVREAVFNILGDIEGWRILDLFSGSGVMAIEALSRGACEAISIEQDAKACHHLHQLTTSFQLEKQWHIRKDTLPNALSGLRQQRFDWVFADPPYACGIAEKIPLWLEQHGIYVGLLVIEESVRAEPIWPKGWQVSCRRYGDTNLYFLKQDGSL